MTNLKERFYKEMGQFCGDVHEEIADWWISEICKLAEEMKREEDCGGKTRNVAAITHNTALSALISKVKEI